jgi:hypothetical protein
MVLALEVDMAKKKRINPHCPVPGCQTKRPHNDNPIVQALSTRFSDPRELTMWFKAAIEELRHSMQRDLGEKKWFAYMTRWRQPEELYYRALYVLFLAKADELPHIFSAEVPNGFTAIYRAVNREIFAGHGIFETPHPTLDGGTFTVMKMLNDSAHASFSLMPVGFAAAGDPETQQLFPEYLEHMKRYWVSLNYMEEMFNVGKPKEHVLLGVKNMHKSASAWQQRTTENKNP